MSLLEILQLIGYSTAAALPLWMGASLWKRRRALTRLERVLLALALCMGAWHASNLILTLRAMFGLGVNRWAPLLRLTDTVALVSVTLIYSFLLHVHIHLWAESRARSLTRGERLRVYLSYVTTLFFSVAIPPIWRGAYQPMFAKVSFFVLPFALWACYVLCLVAITDFLIARNTTSQGERKLMRTLATSFVAIGLLIFTVYALKLGKSTDLGQYLNLLANLGSLLPTALLAYHIYRYRYLELIIKESLIVATFAVVVLVSYLYGIRTLGEWLTARYGLRAGAVESLLILSLALLASPLRIWLDKRFRQFFESEAALYRDVVAHIGEHGGKYQQLFDLLHFVEARAVARLGLRRLSFVVRDVQEAASDNDSASNGDHASTLTASGFTSWHQAILRDARRGGGEVIEGAPLLREHGYELAFVLSREGREVGLMLVAVDEDALTHDVRGTLEILARQVAIAIEDCRLVEENVQLERRLAHGERLAALGQMAATVAHEVKNPLSAIKSIAQVMREDEKLCGEYTRDLDLIVGETDRLNRSVTQMLNFTRRPDPDSAKNRSLGDLAQSVAKLLSAEAEERRVTIEVNLVNSQLELGGAHAEAFRDALSNLLLNAIQATPVGGRVKVETTSNDDRLMATVSDSGGGVPEELRERIWEPFFTTRQRGTGLGLAIVRRRIEDVGGTVRLAPSRPGEGAHFELNIPLK
jgi:signal transduction histidine kinase